MEPADDQDVEQPTAPSSPFASTRARAAAARERVESLTVRAQDERTRHGSIDVMFEMADRDSEVGGGIMGGALAYRLFIWILPLTFVAIAGLGLASDAASRSPQSAAKSMGLAGLVSSSVASAADSSARWYALLIGVPLLLYTTRSLLRTLIVVHRLVWADARGAVAKPTLGATLQLLLALVGYFLVSALTTAARHASFGEGLVITLLDPVLYGALWLLISSKLPHRDATWRDLVPGAILFGLGIEVLQVVTSYFIAPQANSKQGTYGSLGIAAALLLGLYLISRLVVSTAVTNATLAGRRKPSPRRAEP